jgi:hypothetical protein
MTYLIAFPDYAGLTLPPIPASWVDVSYHNDCCPSWQTPVDADGRSFVVFIDYPDLADRETASEDRYTVVRVQGDDTFETVCRTRSWITVLDAVGVLDDNC